MFNELAQNEKLTVRIYYYDPGATGNMFDRGYNLAHKWDVQLISSNSTILPNLLRGDEVRQSRQLNLSVFSIMLRERFDAVFVAGYASPSNWLVAILKNWTKTFLLYQADTNILDVQRKPDGKIKRGVKRWFLNRVDCFLVIGDKNRQAYEHYGIPEAKLRWCPYPVDLRRYEAASRDPHLAQRLEELRSRYRIPAGARVIGFCGKLIARKRPQDFVAAIQLLARRDLFGLLIGSGEEEEQLRRTASEEQIAFTGFINQSEIPYHLLLSDIGVICSESDPHPLVATEFAMCGRPVIVSDACGVWGDHDILRPNENGFVYQCANVPELAESITRLIDTPSLLRKFESRSLELAKSQSAQYAAATVVGLLDEISARRHKPDIN